MKPLLIAGALVALTACVETSSQYNTSFERRGIWMLAKTDGDTQLYMDMRSLKWENNGYSYNSKLTGLDDDPVLYMRTRINCDDYRSGNKLQAVYQNGRNLHLSEAERRDLEKIINKPSDPMSVVKAENKAACENARRDFGPDAT